MHFGDHDMDHDGSLYKTVGTDDFVPQSGSTTELLPWKDFTSRLRTLGDKSDTDE